MQLPWPSAVKFLMARKFNVERALVLYQQHEIMRSVQLSLVMSSDHPGNLYLSLLTFQDTRRSHLLRPQLRPSADRTQSGEVHHPALQGSQRGRHRPVQPQPSRAQRGDPPDCAAVRRVPARRGPGATGDSEKWTCIHLQHDKFKIFKL